jgi:hypothetical protein
LQCPFSLQARPVPMGTDLARCSRLNWTAGCAERLSMMIGFESRLPLHLFKNLPESRFTNITAITALSQKFH